MNEQEMRDSKVPTFNTKEELSEYIESLVKQDHDYGTCVYAMSMAATAAFNYVAHHLGVTGMQASCADLDIIRRTRHMKDGFRIVPYEDLIYPQYWDEERAPIYRYALREDHEGRFKKIAEKNLSENPGANNSVLAHWKLLAAGQIP